MQAELELQIATVIREVDGANTMGASALAEHIATALLAGKVLCDAEPVAYKDEQGRTVRISENGKGDGGFVGPDRAIPDAWVRLYAPASLAGNADIGKEGEAGKEGRE